MCSEAMQAGRPRAKHGMCHIATAQVFTSVPSAESKLDKSLVLRVNRQHGTHIRARGEHIATPRSALGDTAVEACKEGHQSQQGRSTPYAARHAGLSVRGTDARSRCEPTMMPSRSSAKAQGIVHPGEGGAVLQPSLAE